MKNIENGGIKTMTSWPVIQKNLDGHIYASKAFEDTQRPSYEALTTFMISGEPVS